MKQKKYGESVALFKDTLEAAKSIVGEESAFTLRLMNNLSEGMRDEILEVTYTKRQNILLEALELQRISLAGRTKGFGENHLDVFTSQYNLAHLIYDMGRCDEARQFYATAIKGLRSKLGENHPLTVECETNFAVCVTG